MLLKKLQPMEMNKWIAVRGFGLLLIVALIVYGLRYVLFAMLFG